MDNLAHSRKKRPKIKPIARKRHNYAYLLASILLSILISYLFVNFSPYHKFQVPALPAGGSNISIPILPIFFTLLGILIFSISTFLFIQKQHGVVLTLTILGYLLMRLIGLTHWIFLILVIGLLITVELFIIKKK